MNYLRSLMLVVFSLSLSFVPMILSAESQNQNVSPISIFVSVTDKVKDTLSQTISKANPNQIQASVSSAVKDVINYFFPKEKESKKITASSSPVKVSEVSDKKNIKIIVQNQKQEIKKVNQTPAPAFFNFTLANLESRLKALESKTFEVKNITNNYIQNISSGGYSYSVPPPNSVQNNTFDSSIGALSARISVLESATSSTSGGSGTSSSQWTTSGSDIYYSTGNVGISTTTPSEKLSVVGNGLFSGSVTATTFYGDGSNLTGLTSSFSTSTTRSVLSSTATGLTYDNSTGIFSLTSGYAIPTTASSTNWNSFYDTPSSRITAGTGLSWSGNTLNSTGVTSIGGLTGAVSTSSLGLLTTHVAEGSNLYFTNARADQRFSILFAATTTDALAEGSVNQYFTNTRARTALSSTATGLTYDNSTGIFSLTSGYAIPTTASTTEWATAFVNRITSVSSPLSLSANSLSISKASSTASGYLSSSDWSIFNSKQDAINSGTSFTANAITATTFYGDGSNLTGITSFSTSTTRSVLSSTATGLTYDNSTGIFSLTSGYAIPTTASSTNWNSFYDTPSSRITAGTGLSWSGNTLNSTGVTSIGGLTGAVATSSLGITSSQWTTSGANISYNAGNVGIGTTTPGSALTVQGSVDIRSSGTADQLRVVGSTSATSLLVDNAGLVAIGQSTTVANHRLIVNGAVYATTWFTAGIGGGVRNAGNGNNNITFDNFGATTYKALAGAHHAFQINASEVMRVSSAGNLGIATTTPSEKLSVVGNGLFSGTVTASTFYGDGSNLTGITSFSTSTTRSVLSSTATGLTYDNSTGIFSLTSGYAIPTTASSTNWNSFYDTPSSRITAGTGLSWSGNTLNAVGGSSQWTTTGSDIYYSTGNVGIGTTTPGSALTVNGSGSFTGSVNVLGIGAATSTINTDILLSGDIIPSTDNTYRLGSPSRMWRDVYIGPGSLYVNGQKVLQTDISNNVTVSADLNQNLVMKTTGTGDVEFNPSGTGQILVKGNLRLTAGKTIVTSDLSPVPFTDGVDGGNIRIEDNRIGVTNLNGGISIEPNGIGGTYFTSGNVGISTTTPSQKLSVVGNGLFSGSVTASTFYGDGSNLTGITSFSTSTTRSVLSSTATGLTYDNSTGIFSLTSGYVIPTTASSTNWNSFYDTPSSRITAGTGLSWSGNTLGLSAPISIANGGTGTTTAPTVGQLLMGNASGGYDLVSTSSLGISGGGVSSQWTTSGSDIFYSTGNVGIGTTTPFARLGVAATVGSSNDIFSVTSATNNRHFAVASSGRAYVGSGTPSINSRLTIFSDRSDDALVFRDTASSSNARIYLSQPLGTPPAATLNIEVDRLFLRTILYANNLSAYSGTLTLANQGALLLGSSPSIIFRTNVNDTNVFTAGASQNTVIRPYFSGSVYNNLLLAPEGGNVGIGTSTPTTKFMINGLGSTASAGGGSGTAQAFIGTGGTTNIGLVIRGVLNQSSPLQMWQSVNGTLLGTVNNNGVLYLNSTNALADGLEAGYATVNGYTAMLGNGGSGYGVGINSTRFNIGTGTLANPIFTVVKATGNTGVGIVTPLYALDVSRATTTNYIARILNSANSSSAHGLLIQGGDNTTGGSEMVSFNRNDGTSVGSITQNGASGVLYNTTSDRRMKENIVNTRYSLDDLMKIEIKDYNFIFDSNKTLSNGLIAQELYEIYPEAVSRPIDESKSNWGVDYGRMTPLIIKGVQDLASSTFAIRDFDITKIAGQTFVSKLVSWLGNTMNGIQTLFAQKVKTQELCIDDVCVTKEQFSKMVQASQTVSATSTGAHGVTIYDQVNGQPYCIKMLVGNLVTAQGECGNESAINIPVNPTPDTGSSPLIVVPDSSSQNQNSPEVPADSNQNNTSTSTDNTAPVSTPEVTEPVVSPTPTDSTESVQAQPAEPPAPTPDPVQVSE